MRLRSNRRAEHPFDPRRMNFASGQRALASRGAAAEVGEEVAAAEESLGAVGVEDDPRLERAGRLERDLSREVRLHAAGHVFLRRTLRREDQMDTSRARLRAE